MFFIPFLLEKFLFTLLVIIYTLSSVHELFFKGGDFFCGGLNCIGDNRNKTQSGSVSIKIINNLEKQ